MEDDPDLGVPYATPSLVSLAPFWPSVSPSPRRLSSNFSHPSSPVRQARQLTWVSLQGRLEGAEEASSVKTIGGSLCPEEALAWELFSPIHRILIVAVVAVAAADLKKSRQIWKLRRSVDLRDQVLSNMQQKLDDLFEQVNTVKDRPENGADMLFNKNKEFPFGEDTKSDEVTFSACGCQHCDEHRLSSNGLMQGSFEKAFGGDEAFKFKMPLTNGAEQQEERRMSDLSDWASSVTSAADIQLNSLAIDQDIYNLQRECEEKDATIKELSAVIHASDVASSKRVAELEDIIRRKNMIITKLKKDMVVLEQQVVHLTRLRRPSFSAPNTNIRPLPVMADNLLYDMDSSTSPSSSDPDSPTKEQSRGSAHEDQKGLVPCKDIDVTRVQTVSKAKALISSQRSPDSSPKLQSVSPLKETSVNQRPDSTVMLRPRQLVSAAGDMKRSRRHTQFGSKDIAPKKR